MTINMMPPGQQAQGQPGQGAAAPAAAPAATPVATSLEQRWANYFASPSVRAAALQFAVSAVQPIPQGQTVGGHIGLAVGDAAQAATRNESFRQKMKGEQADIEQGQQNANTALDRNAIEREQLGETKAENLRKDKRETAALERSTAQDAIKNSLDARRTAAYETMAGKSGSASSPDNEMLKKRLDLISGIAQDRALLEDDFDPIKYFDEQAGKLGGGAATPVTQGGTAVTAPPPVGTIDGGYKFLGGDPNDPNRWEKVK